MLRINQKSFLSSTALAAVLVVASFSVVSCDGNSGGVNPPTVPPVGVVPPSPAPPPSPPPEPPSPPSPPPGPPAPSPSGWVKGVFQPMTNFQDRCVHPRTGQDPDSSRTYPDVRGKMLDEMFYLRSFTNKTYLWNDEVVDEDPIKYDKPKTTFAKHYQDMRTYFNTLKTNQKSTTNPSRDKDQFHFTQTTEAFNNSQNATPRPAYGIEWYSPKRNLYQCCWYNVDRDVRVDYIIAGSPADKLTGVKLKRGDKLIKINDLDFLRGPLNQDYSAKLINPLLYPKVGESNKFEFQDVDTGESKTITIQAADVVEKAVNNTSVITADDGKKVGYINFTTFNTYPSEKEINDAIGEMKTAKVEDLVLDLRYNGGGFLWVAAQVGHMISGISWPTAGNPQPNFIKFKFNDDAGNKDPRSGRTNQPVPFVNFCLGGKFSITPCPEHDDYQLRPKLNTLNLKRVYILSSSQTCSASEAVINSLRGADIEVILIGDRTCGKPYGFVPEHNCGITYYTIQFQIRNNKDFGEYWDGLMPNNATYSHGVKIKGCYVEDDYKKELGSKDETLLAAALKYRKDGTCPPLPAPPPSPSPPSGIANADKLIANSDVGGRFTPELGASLEFPQEKLSDNNLDISVPAGVREYLEDINNSD